MLNPLRARANALALFGRKENMKKFLAVLSVLIITCGTRIISLASPDDPNGWQNDDVISSMMQVIPEITGKTPNDQFYSSVWNLGFNPQDNASLFLYNMSGNLWSYVSSDLVLNGDYVTVPANCKYVNYSVTLNESNVYTGGNSYTVQLSSEFQWVGAYGDLTDNGDYHDYSIPNFSGRFVTPINENITEPQICVGFLYSHGGGGRRRGENNITPEPSSTPAQNRFLEYNVEVIARFGICNNFNISGTGSFLNWYPVNIDYTDFVTVYDVSDNKKVSDMGNNDFYLSLPNTIQEWTDLYNSNVESIVFNWNANITATGKNYQENNYKNNNMKYAGVQYNIADVYVRFVKMVNGEKHVGNWTHYVNSDVGTGTPPYNSIDVIPIEPSSNTSILDPDAGNNLIENGDRDNTLLPDVNVNTIVNMPNQNQLNYPTVVSYNKDVVFQEWAGFAERIPNFFTSITAFATMAFSFIPSEIWAIIGMGLVLSIAVMVLKIL